MSKHIQQKQGVTELELQRCVDGELNVEERRKLIRQLDQTGHGWRSLALLFIEEQEFGHGCREFLAEAPPSKSQSSPRHFQESPRGWLNVSWPLVAASVIVGLFTPLAWNLSKPTAPSPELGQQTTPATAPEPEAPGIPVATPTVQQTTEFPQNMTVPAPALAVTEQAPKPVTNLNLVSDGGGDPVSIPVYSSEHFQQVWPKGSSMLPQEVDTMLQQRGLRLERQPNVIYYRLDDGSSIAVPVESFHVHPVMQ